MYKNNKKENRRLAVFRLGSLLYLLLTPLYNTFSTQIVKRFLCFFRNFLENSSL
jgi:hypothetical protein